jgi:hypothetical protein
MIRVMNVNNVILLMFMHFQILKEILEAAI